MKLRFKGPRPPYLLLRAANWIGDAVMMTPALCALRRRFPRAQITVLAKPWVVPVFEESPHVDRILVYDKDGRHKGVRGFFRLTRELRAFGFDAAILYQNAFEAALIAYGSGIPVRVGYPTDGRGFLLTHRSTLPLPHRKTHQVDYYLGILEETEVSIKCRRLHLSIGTEAAQRARRTLTRFGIQNHKVRVGMNPGAAYGPAKQWPLERFAAVGDRIAEAFGAQILVFGGPNDRPLGFELCRRMKHPAVNLAGETDLAEAMALIRECTLFVTNDSGLMHVASALEVPLIAIFGSTDPQRTGPWGFRGALLRSGIPCSPCLESVCPLGHLQCMREIGADKVFEAAKAYL